MFQIIKSDTFLKDIKTLIKKHYDFETFKKVIQLLENEGLLPNKFKEHTLVGNFKGLRECHIDKNIILIYEKNLISKEIILYRIGNHKDLLNK